MPFLRIFSLIRAISLISMEFLEVSKWESSHNLILFYIKYLQNLKEIHGKLLKLWFFQIYIFPTKCVKSRYLHCISNFNPLVTFTIANAKKWAIKQLSTVIWGGGTSILTRDLFSILVSFLCFLVHFDGGNKG